METPSIPGALALALAGRYTLERPIGQGGMATVFLARDEKHGRQVAVKVLRPDLAATLGAEQFRRAPASPYPRADRFRRGRRLSLLRHAVHRR